jgi:Domain of unknown function (DUF5666)
MEADMRRYVRALPLAAVVLVGWLASEATAQEKTARGTVTAMSGNSMTVKAGTQELKFTVDAKTTVVATGGSTASRTAEAAGKGGPSLSELIKVGEAVEVNYTEAGGALHATRVRRIRDAGSGGGTTSEEKAADKAESASGTVDSLSGSTLTISGSAGGGATSKQTFAFDSTTRVIGEGAGTAASARGGKLVLTDYIAPGDRVTIRYTKSGATLHASEIRVTQKAKK